ncbi:MAG: DoxX family protein [Dokdonella sp.]|jgi:putative oxidoreductase|nr:DoxX family protein [Dokdonella sp.]MCB1573553.1 DoxX family protein [Xanthomonadales bacterium]MCB1579246.1 DoxX family protein [Xanthomonadales bacterium]
MKAIVAVLIDWPERVAAHIAWLGPLVARITVGWVFLWAGWGKLGALPLVIENFRGWGVPAPEILAPFVSGLEFVGGIALILGLFTRIFSAPLIVVMIVAIKSAFWDQVDSLEYLLGLVEFAYLAIFLWLSVAGPGVVSIDHLLQRSVKSDRH